MGASVRPTEDPALRLQYYKDTGQHDEAAKYEQYLKETGQHPDTPSLGSRVANAVRGGVEQMVTHPLDTAAGLVTAPLRSLGTMLSPGVGEARPDARLSKGGNSSGRPIDTTPYDAAHGGVTSAQRTAGGLQTVANLAFPGVASGVSGTAIRAGAPMALSRMLGMAAGGGAAGAAYSPGDPLAGGLAGAVMAPVVGETVRAVGKLGGTALTTAGARPTGRTAPEIHADAATLRAPLGPQGGAAASATPAMETAFNKQPLSPLPSTATRVRAAVGRGVEATGIESARTLGTRELGRRLELDNVAPADAIAFAQQNANKPVMPLDLGGGNVSGLARLAKDVPGLGRRLIPDALHERSSGTDGATLGRITNDIEQRIGLKPEDYYANVDEMIGQQKKLTKPDYDKVRDITIDDPEVLSLFDIPKFRHVHEQIAEAESIRPNGQKILPLSSSSEVGGETARVQNPQTLGTLDKMRRYVTRVARGKIDSPTIDREMAGAMLERLDAATARLDAMHPDYADARAGYAGRERMKEAYENGKAEFMKLDPREINAKLAKMPESQADLYRRGGYDALRSDKLTKMDDGANIGGWLEKNPDIRARVSALAKNADDGAALRGDFGVERHMGNRKNAILGGPNSAERTIEYAETQPRVTQLGNAARMIPGLGKLAGGLIDNQLTRRTAGQTGDVMGEIAKMMVSQGPDAMEQLMAAVEALRASDRAALTSPKPHLSRAVGLGVGAGSSKQRD